MSEQDEFNQAVREAVEYALDEADNVEEKGDIDTMVSAWIDGRTKFASDMKKHGNETRSGWTVGGVKMTDKYGIVLASLQTQHYRVKRRAYEAFAERMGELGWNCSLDIDQYAY